MKPKPATTHGLPPTFLRTAARTGASVLYVLWLGHMYMGSKGFAMRSPGSLIYSETLVNCTRMVYPLDFFGRRHAGGASVFHVLWLGHMYMGIIPDLR
jgi:hypothetical protein